ncbi:MAG: endonuclease [Mycobacterium sp.]|jgi:hypothetical protein|nr:endonuclease [Mycobacterium sp.]
MFESLVLVDPDADESALVERIAELERLKSAAAAGQVRVTAVLDVSRRAAEAARGVPAGKRGWGVGSEVALRRAADTCGDGRGRGQSPASGGAPRWLGYTLVERVAGRAAEVPVPVAVNLVITDESLLAGENEPARVEGYGPVPAAIARRLVAAGLKDRRSRASLRRLYKHPRSGALVAMESRARLFPKGVCEACNYAKEAAPGWTVTASQDETGCHHAEFTTPTGARHHSKAPPLPGPRRIDISTIEVDIGILIAKHAD